MATVLDARDCGDLLMEQLMVTSAHRSAASGEAADMGAVHNSILQGRGNLSGIIAEHMVAEMIGAERRNTKDYDLVMPDGTTVDVKCKRTHYKPEADFEASIAATSTHQRCDIYCFARILYNTSWLYVMGFYPKDLYLADATYLRKGDYDPSNDFTVKWSCHNLPHHRLMTWSEAYAHVLSKRPI
ncbi:hypothetical protein RPALISO_107 [Ruegeria phage RpAliso]|nr:hypothetical protein RPALISO_107 [Ruegeria phage RpAliso]